MKRGGNKRGGNKENLNPGQIEDLLETLSSSKKTPSSFKTPSRGQLNNIRRTLLQPLSVHNNNVKQHPTMSRTLSTTGIENEDPSIVAAKEQDASSSEILSSPLALPLLSSPDMQIAPPTLPSLPSLPTSAAATTTTSSTAATTTTTTTSASTTSVSITTTMAMTPTPITSLGATSGETPAATLAATLAATPAATPAVTSGDTTGHGSSHNPGTAPGLFLFSNFGPGVSQSIEENEDNIEDETDKEIETGTKKKQVYKNPTVRRHEKEISFSTINRDSYIHDKKAYAKKCEQWSNRLKTANSKFKELQGAFDLPPNYITIVEDNMHKTGHSESKLAGRLLASGKGPLFQNFVHNKKGIRYKKDVFFLLKNVNELKANSRHVSDV